MIKKGKCLMCGAETISNGHTSKKYCGDKYTKGTCFAKAEVIARRKRYVRDYISPKSSTYKIKLADKQFVSDLSFLNV